MHESWEEVDEGEMPPWLYLPPHPEARLTPADLALARDLARGARGRDGEEEGRRR